MQVGDKIKVIDKWSSKIGSVGKIFSIANNDGNLIYSVSFPDDVYWFSFYANQLEVVAGENPAAIPAHYQSDSSTIDVIDFCKMYNLNFNKGNVVKYTCRAGKKDDEIKDLQKAVDYLQREIEFLKKQITMGKENAKISKSAHVVITDENESKVEFNFSLEKENGSEFLKMNVDFGERAQMIAQE